MNVSDSISSDDRMWAIFHEARDLPADAREVFLAHACNGDHRLLEGVREHLRLDAAIPTQFFERGAGAAVMESVFEDAIDEAFVSRWIGRTIGRYTIEAHIDEGGMGVVFRGRHEETGQIAAVKVMHARAMSPLILRRFQREWRILARLQHPNVARIYDADVDDDGAGGVPWFAMELIQDAQSLTEYARTHDLSIQRKLELFAQVCDGVGHAHTAESPIIHRDLKPANILVDSLGRPKVIDFGIARAAHLTDGTITMAAGGIAGTIAYMSPEQWVSGSPEVSPRSDVYSLGVILHELLTGEHPYDVPTRSLADAERVIREQPNRRIPKGTPRRSELQAVLDGALAKDARERRYETAVQLAEDIRRVLGNEVVTARPRTRAYRARKFIARNRGVCAATAAIFVILLAATVISSWQAVRATQAARLATDRFHDLRSLSRFLYNVHELIQDKPGTTAARAAVAEALVDFNMRLAEQAGGDPSFLYDSAQGLIQAAEIRGNHLRSNLGDLAGAAEAYGAAREIVASIIPNNPKEEFLLAKADMGCLLTPLPSEVLDDRRLARARQLSESFARLAPVIDTAEAYEYLVFSHAYVGHEMKVGGDVAGAIERLTEAAFKIGRAAEQRFDDPEIHRAIADCILHRGTFRRELGDLVGASSDLRDARSRYRKLIDGQPSNAFYQMRLTTVFSEMGLVEAQLGNALDARQWLNLAAHEAEQAWMNDADNAFAHRHYSITVARLAEGMMALAKHPRVAEIDRLEIWQSAEAAGMAYQSLVHERQTRGWLHHWESDYPAEAAGMVEAARAGVRDCDTVLSD